MGRCSPQLNIVLKHADENLSYRDERWRVGKLVMSRAQIQFKIFYHVDHA